MINVKKVVLITAKGIKNLYGETKRYVKGHFLKYVKNNKSIEKVLRYTKRPETTVAKSNISQKIVNFWQSNSRRNKILIVLISFLSSSSLMYIIIRGRFHILKPSIKYYAYLAPLARTTLLDS
jgi:hypothetical protein